MNARHVPLMTATLGGSLAFLASCPIGPRIAFDNPERMGTAILDRVNATHTETKSLIEKGNTKIAELDGRMMEIEQKMSRPMGGGPSTMETWGEQVTKSGDFDAIRQKGGGKVRIGVKMLTSAGNSAGALAPPDRSVTPTMLSRRRLRLRDLFAPGQTTANSIEWPKQITRTNSAAIVADGTLKPESSMTFDLVPWPVRTLAHWMIATKQLLDDVPAMQSIIDGELRYGLAYVEDLQLLMGAGTGQDLRGVYTGATAFVPPFEIAGTTMLDKLLQGIAQVQALDYEPDGIVVNPLDWARIMALKDTEGRYLGGGPFAAQAEILWTLPMVPTRAMTEDKFLVGAFKQGAQIFDRQEATVELSTEDSDNFRRNLITLRGEQRLAFVIKQADAFVKGDFGNVT